MTNILLINYLVTGVITIIAFEIFFSDTDINFIKKELSLCINGTLQTTGILFILLVGM